MVQEQEALTAEAVEELELMMLKWISNDFV